MLFKNASVSTLASVSLVCTATAGESASEKSSKAADITPLLTPVENTGPQWGVGIGLRVAKTAFKGEDQNVEDILPMFYYEGERFFVRGTEGGVHLWDNDQFGFDALTRYRYFDFPEELEGDLDRHSFDLGLRAYWNLNETSRLAAEILTDFDGRMHGSARWEADYYGNRWSLSPLVELRLKSSDFNSYYYGLDLDDVDAGIDARAAVKGRYHVWRNLHLEGSLEARWLDGNTQDSRMIDDSMEYMAYIGVGFFEDPIKSYAKSSGSTLNAKPYYRISQGWGNDSTLAQIFAGDIRKDSGADVNMTSFFYGHPLADTLFGLPIETYITPGVVHHWSSDVQSSATELVLGFKFYYTIPTPWRVRLGAAEGISYIDSFTYYEENSLTSDDHVPNRLLNYVDLSVDLNIGDVFCSKTFEDLWLGYGIHHRSGIGGSSPTFGNIAGGSNFNTIYLQWSGKF